MLESIQAKLVAFVLHDAQGAMPDLGGLRLYDRPLLAVASAADPLWTRLKNDNVAGPAHLLPTEWMAGAKSVLSYFLPFTEPVRKANRATGLPATEWLYGRWEGEIFNRAVRDCLVKAVAAAGAHAMAPALDERFAYLSGPTAETRGNFRSNWSERHVAFVAGLGTFSLNRSLITEKGSAGRFGSVITDLELAATPRPYTTVDEYCTKCGVCALRCPANAIDDGGKDNALCADYLAETRRKYSPRYGCGKCQTAVPCESGIPARS